MYNQRKKRMITIAISTVITIIVLALGGFYIYAKTDLLRANDELFFKYANLGLQDLKIVENKQLSAIEQLKEQKDYKIEGKINYKKEKDNSNSVSVDTNFQMIASKKNDFAYSKINLLKDDQSIFNVDFAKSNNIYAFKSNEIANAYIGIQNENLKSLAAKLGIPDTSKIPDSLKVANFSELLNLSEDEKTYIKETYVNVLQQNIDKSKFTKDSGYTEIREGESYTTTAYRLTLSSEELKQVEIAVLKKIQEDDVTLEIITRKAKILGLDEKYTEVNSLKKELQIQILSMQNKSENSGGISIIICVNRGKVILTQIIYKNEIKFTIYGSASESLSKRYLLIENLDVDAKYSKIEINEQEKREESESVYDFSVNVNDKANTNINLIIKGTPQDNNLNATASIKIDDKESSKHVIESSWKMSFGDMASENMIKLDTTNTGILNNYNEEQLRVLMQALEERIGAIISQKIQILGMTNQDNTNAYDNEN